MLNCECNLFRRDSKCYKFLSCEKNIKKAQDLKWNRTVKYPRASRDEIRCMNSLILHPSFFSQTLLSRIKFGRWVLLETFQLWFISWEINIVLDHVICFYSFNLTNYSFIKSFTETNHWFSATNPWYKLIADSCYFLVMTIFVQLHTHVQSSNCITFFPHGGGKWINVLQYSHFQVFVLNVSTTFTFLWNYLLFTSRHLSDSCCCFAFRDFRYTT